MTEQPACGARFETHPESVCTEPPGHDDWHSGPLVADGRVIGGGSWGDARALPAIRTAAVTQPPWHPNHGPTPEQATAAIRTAAGQDQPTTRTALRDLITDALLTARRTDYEGAANHGEHRYDARCALCAADVDALADAVLAVLPEATSLTWAEGVASHGTGPNATIDIDVNLPGRDEPVPMELPLTEARLLHRMVGDLITEHDPAGQGQPHDRRALPCPGAVLTRPHPAHDWEPQPGMTPVRCPGVPDAARRARIAATMWAAAEHTIVAEWICCEPLAPGHDLCAKGYAALDMIRALIVDTPEAYRPAPLTDAVVAVVDAEQRELRAELELAGRVKRSAARDAAAALTAQIAAEAERDRLCAELSAFVREAGTLRTRHADLAAQAADLDDRVTAELAQTRSAALTPAERQFLTFALDQAAEEMSLADGFTDDDEAALEKLRRMAAEAQQGTE